MKNITTLGKVFDRVDKQSAKCHDELIPVKDIEFDKLDTHLLNRGLEHTTTETVGSKAT